MKWVLNISFEDRSVIFRVFRTRKLVNWVWAMLDVWTKQSWIIEFSIWLRAQGNIIITFVLYDFDLKIKFRQTSVKPQATNKNDKFPHLSTNVNWCHKSLIRFDPIKTYLGRSSPNRIKISQKKYSKNLKKKIWQKTKRI